MLSDVRECGLYREIEARAVTWHRPGTDQITGAEDLATSPDGTCVAFSATCMGLLEGEPGSQIAIFDLRSRTVRVLTHGPGAARLPAWSPDGSHIAFVSDATGYGQTRLLLVDVSTGAVKPTPAIEGWAEYVRWSGDGKRLMVGVAGVGADRCGSEGATPLIGPKDGPPTWMPWIEAATQPSQWRSLWILDLVKGKAERASPEGVNVWDADWSGAHHAVCVASDDWEEGAWYAATLRLIDLSSRSCRELYRPSAQLGIPVACPSGRRVLIIEAVCSDRRVVAGELLVVDTDSGRASRVSTDEVDVSHVQWSTEHWIVYAGHRSLHTVIAATHLETGEVRQLWRGTDQTCGDLTYPEAAAIRGDPGRAIAVVEGLVSPPALSLLGKEGSRELLSFAAPDLDVALSRVSCQPVQWQSADGLDIEGWWIRPDVGGNCPAIVEIHGGPVWMHRPRYLGRAALRMALLEREYGIFLPNPRGSSGRGRDFSTRVIGDVGGKDAGDLLSGVDWLIENGSADRRRLAIWGGSYGGFLAAWLVTRDHRFAAAAAVAPTTDWISQRLTCHIPEFCDIFLADSLERDQSEFNRRSPVRYAHRVRTPVLSVCGALDRVTPPGQAVEFHNAIRRRVRAILLTYPQEGHGIRRYPAVLDFAARMTAWFDLHLAARAQ